MSKSKLVLRTRSVPVNGLWHDHFANHWYEYPRNTFTDPPQIPSIWLRGHWITGAGFPIGGRVDIDVSPGVITLRLRAECSDTPAQ